MMNLPRLSVATATLILALAAGCGGDDPVGGDGGDPPVDPPGDTVAPQTVSDLSLAYRAASDDVEFAWTAPRDDAETDRVARYDIRYSYSFPLDWDLSVPIIDAPAPEPEGTPQSYVLVAPGRGRNLYAAARTYDDAGNPSAVGPVTHLRVPGVRFEALCEDVFTRAPVEGLAALLTAGVSWNLTTGPDGVLVLDDISGGTLGIRVQSGAAPTIYHDFEHTFVMDQDVTLAIPMVPVVAADSPLYANTLQIVIDALVVSGGGRVLKRWHNYPVPWYAPAYVNGNGLDYTALTRQAAAQWNARVGTDLFVEVGSPPAAGIEFLYLSRASMGIQNGFTEHENDPDGYPAGETIKIVNDFSDGVKLYSILMHELGHTIRLDHLPAGFLMYGGQPLPGDVTDDEVGAVQMMLAIPNGTDLARYDEFTPLP